MVRLEKLSYDNIWKVLALEVEESQKSFVATNTQSIAEAYLALANGEIALPFAVMDDTTPVGFVMLSYAYAPDAERGPESVLSKPCYSVWRLMIDKRFQHRGYGRQAMTLALDYIAAKPCGEAEYCYLSYEPENVNAREMYHSFGFEENGEMDDEEIIAVKKL